jgi:LysM repeat protein
MDQRPRSSAPRGAKRRKITPLTIFAPAAAIALWIGFFAALGSSCVFKECAKEDKDTTAATARANELPPNARAKVRAGDTLSAIATKHGLTNEELEACNPDVDSQSLQPGDFLFVSAERCEGADLAKAGANPDPLSGETSAGSASNTSTNEATTPPPNGTAEADPSAKTQSTTPTSAE